MIEYVLIYAYRPDGKITLVLKDRPASQKGKLNLVGGKIEPGEEPFFAAIREFKEETGLDIVSPQFSGMVSGVDFKIYCFSVKIEDKFEIKPMEGETELVDWYDLSVISDSRLMKNLRVVIPLFNSGMTGWTIKDDLSQTDNDIVVRF